MDLAQGISTATVAGVSSLVVGMAVMMWRRRNQLDDKTSRHGERLATLETRVASLEKTTEKGFDRIADKIDALPCRTVGLCPSIERKIA